MSVVDQLESLRQQASLMWVILAVLVFWCLALAFLVGALLGRVKALRQVTITNIRLTKEMAEALAQSDEDEAWDPDEEPKGDLPGDEWKHR